MKLPKQVKDLTGQTFKRLTVLEYVGQTGYHESKWLCQCSCGNKVTTSGVRLRSGGVKSCGCLKLERTKERWIDYRRSFLGKKYGRLSVEEFVDVINNASRLKCKCDCGESCIVRLGDLQSGDTKSCGCLARETFNEMITSHGLSTHHLYDTWNDMIQRCYNENAPNYKYYGGRGIRVCDEWRSSPSSFIEWAEQNGHSKGLTLDRGNNDGNYEPDNCRWVTMTVQNRNQSNTLLTEGKASAIRSDDRPTAIIAKQYGVSTTTIRAIKRNLLWKETTHVAQDSQTEFD